MFSVEWNKSVENISGRTGVVFKTPEGGIPIRICNVTSWGMGSCAVATLQSWGWGLRIQPDEVDQLLNWLCENIDSDWQPNEFYFLLSSTQIKRSFAPLVKHPNVRLRDKFENKSHGPNKVFLYRYSKAEDFKRVITKRSKA